MTDKVNMDDIKDVFDLPDEKRVVDVESNQSFDENVSDLGDVISSIDSEKSKDLVATEEATEEAQEEVQEEKQEEVNVEQFPKKTNDENVLWNNKSPTQKFNVFYEQKKNLIERILIGGPIPFKKYRNDLKNSNVDISTQVFDTNEIYKKMEIVQGMRERVKLIQISCNSQIFLWERGIQLMHGMLARVEYDKPAVKQDGVIYEHMGDMELYFHELKGLYKSADAVMKTLDGAYDCLSRRVTIALPLKPMERYAKQEEPKASNPDLKNYDSLEEISNKDFAQQKKIDKNNKKTGVVEWSELL